jgi:acyl carrier protein
MKQDPFDNVNPSFEVPKEPQDEETEKELWKYLENNCLPQGTTFKYSNEESLFNTGILDSAALISFVLFIETRFSLTIPDEDLLPENFTSISSISSYIRDKKGSRREV